MVKRKFQILRNSLVILFFALIVIGPLQPRINLIHAQDLTTFYVDPPSTTDTSLTPGSSYTIDINVLDADNLWGWQVSFYWDYTVLDYVGHTFAGFLTDQPEGSTQTSDASLVDYGLLLCTELTFGDHPGVTTAFGLLMSVEFEVAAVGETTIEIDDSLTFWMEDAVTVWGDDPDEMIKENGYFSNMEVVEYDLTIEVVGSGTTDPAPGVHTYDADTEVPVDALPAAGWMLDHWLLDDVDVGDADPYTVTMDTDHTLTAVFVVIPIQYDLTIEVVGSGTTDPAPGVHTYDADTEVPVDALPAAGWMLDHWLLDDVDVGDADPYTVTMDDNHTLTAVFVEIVQYDLTIEVVGSGTTNPAPGVHTYDEDTEVPVDALPAAGWKLSHWLLDDVDVGDADPYTVTMDDNHTLTAVFVEIVIQYELTIEEPIGNGTTIPSPGTYLFVESTMVNVSSVPDSGWKLSHWLLDDVDVGDADPYTVIMDANHTIQAVFVGIPSIQYDLTIEVVGSGTTNPSPGVYTYDADTDVPVDALPDPGWMLDHWLLDDVDVGDADPYTVTMDANHTLTAVFVEIVIQYELTIEVVGNGTTNPAPGVHTYDEDTEVPVDALPDPDWMLDHWLLDSVDVGSADPYTVIMDANHTLTAVFIEAPIPIHYELTIEVVGNGTTDPSPGTYTYDEDTEVPVDAIPDPGWMLDHWLLDGVDVGDADPYTVFMDANHTLTAVFTEIVIPPTLIYVDPSIVTANPGGYFTINVSIADVIDLFGWQFKLRWPTGLLEVNAKNITEGPFLKAAGMTGFAKKVYTNYIDIGCTLLAAVPGVDGSGTLATATFKVLKTGNATLELYFTKLLNSTQDEISHTPQDGYFYTTWPVADFSYSPNPLDNPGHPIQDETITFNASSSYDPDDPYDLTPVGIVTYDWDFGDGESDTGQIVTHAYNTTGSYQVILTVTDDDGETYHLSRSILVLLHDISVIEVVIDPVEVVVGDPVTINATILNNGSVSETFNATVYYDDMPIDTKTYLTLSPAKNTTLSFTWIADVAPGEYTIKAYAYMVDPSTLEARPDLETNMIDNTLIDGTVNVISVAVHDVAVDAVTAPAEAIQGDFVPINVSVSNPGGFNETFDVEVTYDTTSIDSQSVTLTSGDSTTLTFSWNTIGVPASTYMITAEAILATDEVPANNIANATIEITTVVHDIAILDVVPSTLEVVVGDSVDINVTIMNEGTVEETFTVNVYAGGEPIGTTTWTLDSSAEETLTFTWTTNLTGSFLIEAEVPSVPGEIDTADNGFPDGEVTVIPHTTEHPVEVDGVTFNVIVESNSTVSDFTFDQGQKEISFNVTGPEGTVGFCNVTIPKALLGDPFTVLINSTPLPYELTENATHYFVYFTYSHSIQTIHIIGTTVATPPIASFTYSPAAPTTGETVTFDASASYDPDGTIVSYEWDFGDGNKTTVAVDHVDHAYTDNGIYLVTLTVTDNDGLSDTTSKSITVLNRPPTAIFTESAETVYIGETITFDASDSYDPDGTIVSYFWDFGDTMNATGVVVAHAYADDGSYTVTLTVTDDDGATNSTSATKTVLPPELEPPVASFSYSPLSPVVNETINFDASASYDPDGTIVSYEWDFGDGTPGSGVTTTHAYTMAATYVVTLTVTDNDGLSDNATQEVTVTEVAELTAVVNIDPNTLNLESKGKWITCYISLPEGYDVGDIDVSTILLDSVIPAMRGEAVGDVLIVKFDRVEVIQYIKDVLRIASGEVTLTITGDLIHGVSFEGEDTIRVISKRE